jgi:HK97 family phage portal protein
MVAAAALARYAQNFATSGAVPNAVLTYPGRLSRERVLELQAQWVDARMSGMGLPAVLSGGIDFKTLAYNPKDLALVELSQWNEARIAVLLKVPPICVALPSGGDSMTYSNVESLFDYRWRAGLSTLAANLMAALSGWALPRGTTVEVNRDEFVKAPPLERAQTHAIYVGLGIETVEEAREAERFGIAAPSESLSSGVLQ